MSWYRRAYSRASSYVSSSWVGRSASWMGRAVLSGMAALRRAPPRPGITSGRVATLPWAEQDLGALATSPTVYGAVVRRALELANHPIKVYRGYSMGGGDLEQVTGGKAATSWVDEFYDLLATPDPASRDELAPEPGEGLIMQVVADLILTGAFVIVPTIDVESGRLTGQTRLHPGCCTIERFRDGREELVYRNAGEVRRYPRRMVFIGRMVSWERDGRSEFGTGAGASLRPLVRAEATALQRTADVVEQGGADIRIRGKGATGKNFMAVEDNRKAAVKAVTEAIKADNGQRVMAFSDDLEVEDVGFKPADLQAPEVLKAARANQLVAVQTVPAWVGMETTNYSTAVIQLRVQAGNDEGIATVVEAFWLRPLAQYCARRQAGTMDARRFRRVTARIDLSQHPGNMQTRTEAFGRAKTLVHDLGYTVKQAVKIENLDLPDPEGEILSKGQPAAPDASNSETKPGPDEGSHLDDPRRPVGDQDDEKVIAPKRTILQFLRGNQE